MPEVRSQQVGGATRSKPIKWASSSILWQYYWVQQVGKKDFWLFGPVEKTGGCVDKYMSALSGSNGLKDYGP